MVRNKAAYYSVDHQRLLEACAVKTLRRLGSSPLEKEDLVQECWWNYARYYPFEVLRKNIKSIFGWMYRIARRWFAYSDIVDSDELRLDEDMPVEDSFVEDTDEFKVRQGRMKAIIEQLPFKHQIVINWYFIGVNFQKIGRLVGMTGEGCRQIVNRVTNANPA